MVRVDGLGWKNCFIWRCRVRTTNQSATSTQKMQDNKVSVGRTQKGKNYNCNIGWTTHQHHHNHRHPHRMYSFVEQCDIFGFRQLWSWGTIVVSEEIRGTATNTQHTNQEEEEKGATDRDTEAFLFAMEQQHIIQYGTVTAFRYHRQQATMLNEQQRDPT